MNKYIIFLLTLIGFSTQVVGQALVPFIRGQAVEVIPSTPYTYYQGADQLKGYSHKWEVTNGKIMDSSGNYTLSELTTTTNSTNVYVMWEGNGSSTRTGTLKVTVIQSGIAAYSTITPTISPYDLIVSNQTITGSTAREYIAPTVTFTNVTFSSGTNIRVNGYKSVTLNPGFHAISGSSVVMTSTPATVQPANSAFAYFEAPEENVELNPLDVAELGQNIPNPVTSTTRIGYYVPDYISSSYIQIQDVFGNIVTKEVVETGSGELEVDCSRLSKGIYLYSLIVDGNLIDSKRMIVSY